MERVTLLTNKITLMNPPKPFFSDIKKVKAILLGVDPSNNANKGSAVQLEYVFGIEGKDKRYYIGIDKNLAAIGLSRNDIYVQNLIWVQAYKIFEQTENFKRYIE